MPTQRPTDRRCICGHDRTLHAYTATGLGACHATDGAQRGDVLCVCQTFESVRASTRARRLAAFQASYDAALAAARGTR